MFPSSVDCPVLLTHEFVLSLRIKGAINHNFHVIIISRLPVDHLFKFPLRQKFC